MAKIVTRDVHTRNTTLHFEWWELQDLLKKEVLRRLEIEGLLVAGAEYTISIDIKQVQEGGSLPYNVDKWGARIDVSQDFLVRKPEDEPDEP